MLRRVLATGADVTGRSVLLGGAAAPPSLLTEAHDLGVRVVASYGMTETCGGCVYDGRPVDGVDVDVASGLVRVRGAVVADGVLTAPGRVSPLVDDDGWLTTSDHGHRDDDGRLVVTGRADDVVVTGGVNVPTGRVAAAMVAAGATEAVVVGVPDDDWGHRLEAFAVGPEHDVAAWCDHVRTTMGPAAVPKHVHVVASLPRTGLGKPDLQALRARAASDRR